MWMSGKKTKSDAVKVIRLISSREEIIAECEIKENGIFIKDAALIMHMADEKLILGTWMPHTTIQEGFFLSERCFLFYADPEENMLNYYNKWRTTPFTTPEKE